MSIHIHGHIIFPHRYPPPMLTIRSVINPVHNPTKMPIIRIAFVVCFLPELYISIETYTKAPPAVDRKSTYAIGESHRLPTRVPMNVGPPPTKPAKIGNEFLAF